MDIRCKVIRLSQYAYYSIRKDILIKGLHWTWTKSKGSYKFNILLWQKVVELNCNIKCKRLQEFCFWYFCLYLFAFVWQQLRSVLKVSIILKEVRNCILCIICAWSLFCSLQIFINLRYAYSSKKLNSCFSGFFFFCLFCFELEVIFIEFSEHFCNYYLYR